MKRKSLIRLMAFALAVIMPLGMFVLANEATESKSETPVSSGSKYDSLSVNELTGHGEDPEELSVSAGAKYQEKAWYEYVVYSDKAVCSYRVDDETRILFYDPYTYTNAMVMDVQFDATTTEFDTMSEYSISHKTEKTLSARVSSTDTYTSATQESGRDLTHSDVKNDGSSTTTYNHNVDTKTVGSVTDETGYEYILKTTASNTITATFDTKTTVGLNPAAEISAGGSEQITVGGQWVTDKVTNETKYSDDYKTTTTYSGSSTVEDNTTSTTDGWTELSARITKTLGSSSSTSTSWSESESTTVTKTYAATHFAADGVTPLPWAIVHYNVQMPMKCCLQVKHSGEWVTVSTIYSLLTTVKGTCRAWMQNGQVYYEDWGSGEPVVATDFWAQFMTKEQLVASYQDKLYPVSESK